jgi:hypothetical protein
MQFSVCLPACFPFHVTDSNVESDSQRLPDSNICNVWRYYSQVTKLEMKGKGKAHHRTDREGLEEEYRYVQHYSLFNLRTRFGWVVNTMHRPLYPGGRGAVPIMQEAEWVSAPV